MFFSETAGFDQRQSPMAGILGSARNARKGYKNQGAKYLLRRYLGSIGNGQLVVWVAGGLGFEPGYLSQ